MGSPERRPLAVMFTDIAGFTARMERSESDALRILGSQREILSGHLDGQDGTMLKEMGDGTLSVFGTPAAAVRCARGFQEDLRGADFRVRIGIHWGEVLVGEGDVFGDTVNVASRLEEIAAPGGIFVSGELLGNYGSGRKPYTIPLGMRRLKGLGRLVDVHALKGTFRHPLPVESLATVDDALTAAGTREVPTLAVMLLENLGDEQDAFYAYGITTDLVSDLSRVGSISVIPMSTIMKTAAAASSDRDAARRLSAEFLVKGTLWRQKDIFRLSIEMTEVRTDRLVWTDSWQDNWYELASLKGKLADGILKALGREPSSYPGMTGTVTDRVGAYEQYLKAKHLWRVKRSRSDIEKVRRMIAKLLEADPALVPALNLLGETFRESGDFEKGLEIFREASARAKSSGDRKGMLDSENAIAITSWMRADHRSARRGFERVLRMARSIGDREGQGKALSNIGLMDCELAEYPSALDHLARALALAQEIKAPLLQANTLCNIGLVHWRKGDVEKALQHYQKSLDLFVEMNDLAGQSNLLRNIGICHNRSGEPEKALEMAEKGLEIALALDDRPGQCRALNNRGNSLLEMGMDEEARASYDRSLDLARELGLVDMEGVLLTNLGLLALNAGEHDNALGMTRRATDICRRTGDTEGENENLLNQASILVEDGRYHEAVGLLRESSGLAAKVGISSFRAQTAATLANALAHEPDIATHYGEILDLLDQVAGDLPLQTRARAYAVRMASDAIAMLLAQDVPPPRKASELRKMHADLIEEAHENLIEAAARIRDASRRKSFLGNISDHRRILGEWLALGKGR